MDLSQIRHFLAGHVGEYGLWRQVDLDLTLRHPLPLTLEFTADLLRGERGNTRKDML